MSLYNTRRIWFDDCDFPGDFVDMPRNYAAALLYSHHVNRMLIELRVPLEGWSAEEALSRYKRDLEELDRLLALVRTEINVDQDAELSEALHCANPWKDRVFRRLEALVRGELPDADDGLTAPTLPDLTEMDEDSEPDDEYDREDLRLVSEGEAWLRATFPGRVWPEIDDVPISQEMALAAPVKLQTLYHLAAWRKSFFFEYAVTQRYFLRGDDHPGEIGPPEYYESLLYCYRIVRTAIVLHDPPAGFNAAGTLEQYRKDVRRFQHLRTIFSEDWNELNNDRTGVMVERFESRSRAIFLRLEALVQADPDAPSPFLPSRDAGATGDHTFKTIREQELRADNPDWQFPDVDAVPIGQAMVDTADVSDDTLARMVECRRIFFLREENDTRPLALTNLALMCHCVLRTQVELAHASVDWDAKIALGIWNACWAAFERYRSRLNNTDVEVYIGMDQVLGPVPLKWALEVCTASREEVSRKLQDLVSAQQIVQIQVATICCLHRYCGHCS